MASHESREDARADDLGRRDRQLRHASRAQRYQLAQGNQDVAHLCADGLQSYALVLPAAETASL